MTEIQIAHVAGLAKRLNQDYDQATVACAGMLLQYRQAHPDIGLAECDEAIKTASKIYDVMPNVDEPRFSMYDYMDSIANASQNIDLKKLNALDGQDFAVAMIWLAAYKRETYEGLAHDQEPLELDIWREP